MDCQEIRPLLDPLSEGELRPADEARVRSHLDACPDCRGRARELSCLSAALTRLPRPEPRASLMPRTLAVVRRRAGAERAQRAWWAAVLAVGAAAALVVSLWVVGEAANAFVQAGGGELLDLIRTYPRLLLQHPQDTALAVLEAAPAANVALGLATALLACLLGVQFVATASTRRPAGPADPHDWLSGSA